MRNVPEHPRGKCPGEFAFAARGICRMELVVLGRCDSTHIHHFRPKKLDSVADSLLEILNANAESVHALMSTEIGDSQ